MTIGGLKDQLRKLTHDLEVRYDFCGRVPSRIHSWLGLYRHPALDHRDPTLKALTVAELLQILEEATDGRTFKGYRGGDYNFEDTDELHIDNYGEYTNTELVFISHDTDQVILHTTTEPL